MEINASSGSFDEVIRVVPFNSLEDAGAKLPGACYDDFSGFQETAEGLVSPGKWYAVQVGGTLTDISHAQGGPNTQVSFELKRPPTVSADALLFWKTHPLRVTSLTVQGVTKGATVKLTCTKGACKNATRKATKPVWAKPVSAVGAFKPVATAARTKWKLIKNRKVRKNGTITVRITAPGYIGRHFFWKVKSSSLTNKKV